MRAGGRLRGGVTDYQAPHPGTYPAKAWILSGANTYTGATIVTGGTLNLGAAGSIANSTGVSVATGAVLDTTAQASFTMSAAQPFTFHVNGAGSGSAGQLNANGLDITNAVVAFTVDGTPDDAVYVLANYAADSLTGSQFSSVTPPSGYTINYTYNPAAIAETTLSVEWERGDRSLRTDPATGHILGDAEAATSFPIRMQ